MKKITKYLVLLFVLIFPCKIYAYELTCDNGSYTYNDSFNCYLKGAANVDYDTLTGTLQTNNNLTCTRLSVADGFTVNDDTSDYYIDLQGIPTTDIFVTYNCQVTNKITSITNTQLEINDFKYHIRNSGVDASTEILSTDYIVLNPYEEETPSDTKPRDVSNQNSRLKTLKDDNLNITFSQFITEYNVEVLYEVNELNLELIPNNSEAIVEVIGDSKLSVGKNIIDIYVTSPAGDAKTCYTLYITRLARGEDIYYPERDASLSSMTVTGYSIKFDKNIYEYSLYITRDVDSINVNTTTTHEGATVSISPTDNLKDGSVVSVTVKSEDESNTLVYKIKIAKEAEKKDYSAIIFLAIIGALIIILIVLFITSSQKKKKNDPLLTAAKQKRKINKGKKFDVNAVPETNISNQVSNESQQNVTDANTLNNTNITQHVDNNINQASNVTTQDNPAINNLQNQNTTEIK